MRAMTSLNSSCSFCCSSAARRRSCISRIAFACASLRSKRLIKLRARAIGIVRRADRLDDRVEARQRLEQPFEDVRPRPPLVQFEFRAADDHVVAMLDVDLQHPLQAERARLAVDQRQHLNAVGALKLRVFVKLVEHFQRLRARLEFDHQPHPVAGRIRRAGR